jgi:hypothetical protein
MVRQQESSLYLALSFRLAFKVRAACATVVLELKTGLLKVIFVVALAKLAV